MNKIIKQIVTLLKSEYFLLSIIIVLGFVARLYKVNNPVADWHSWRQADTASVSRTFVDFGIDMLHPRYQDISSIQTGYFNPNGWRMVEFPIFNAVHALFFNKIGHFSFDAWGRLVSVFCSLVSALILFLIGKRYLGKWGGVLATFFFLFLPYSIYYSRVILPEPMTIAFALLSLWFFIKFIDSESAFSLLLSGVFFALGMLLKPFTIFYSLPMIYLALSKHLLKEVVKNFPILIKYLLFIDIALIPFILWRAWISNFPAGIPFFTWAFNGDLIRFRPAFWRWIFGERIGRLILGTWGLIPFAYGVIKTEKKNRFNLFFLLGVLLYTIVIATANVRHDYYQIFLIPPIALLLAQGTVALWSDKSVNYWLARPLVVFSIIMMLFMGGYQVKEYYKIDHPEIIAAGKALDKIAPKDALVVAPYNGDTAFLYQTGRWGWPAIDDSIDNIIKKGASYYVSVNQGDSDTQMIVKRFTVVEKTDSYVIVNLLKPKAK